MSEKLESKYTFEVKESDNEVRSFIHDMRNELMILNLYMEKVTKSAKSGDTDQICEDVASVQDKILTLNAGLQGLLQKRYEELDVKETLVEQRKDLSENFKVDIKLHLTGSFKLNTNKSEFRRVIVNVVKNAQEAGAKKLEIILTNNSLVFLDNGPGIDPDTLKIVKAGICTTTKDEGNGLGFECYRGFATRQNMTFLVDNRKKSSGLGLVFKLNKGDRNVK